MSAWTEGGNLGSLRQGEQPGGAPLADLPLGNSFEPCPDMVQGSLRQGTRGDLGDSFTKGRGAGRTFEAVYPQNDVLLTINTSLGITSLSRYGAVDTEQVAIGQAPAADTILLYRGRACFRMAAPTGITAVQGPAVSFPALKGGGRFKGDLANWRAKAIMAFEPSGSGDLGLMMTKDGATNLLTNPSTEGITLRADTTGAVTFYAKVGGGFTMSELCPAAIDIAAWNCYEFRFLAATDTEDGKLKVLINNEEQFTFSFGEGLLPIGVLYTTIGSFSGGVMYLPVGGASVSAAVDESSLL